MNNVIADTERTHPRGNRVVKSIGLFEDDKGHRSAKTTQFLRDSNIVVERNVMKVSWEIEGTVYMEQ